jgi:hypothetical protein
MYLRKYNLPIQIQYTYTIYNTNTIYPHKNNIRTQYTIQIQYTHTKTIYVHNIQYKYNIPTQNNIRTQYAIQIQYTYTIYNINTVYPLKYNVRTQYTIQIQYTYTNTIYVHNTIYPHNYYIPIWWKSWSVVKTFRCDTCRTPSFSSCPWLESP